MVPIHQRYLYTVFLKHQRYLYMVFLNASFKTPKRYGCEEANVGPTGQSGRFLEILVSPSYEEQKWQSLPHVSAVVQNVTKQRDNKKCG